MMQAMYRERLGIEPDVIESGHMTTHSRPEELAALIAGYVEELG